MHEAGFEIGNLLNIKVAERLQLMQIFIIS